MARKTRALTLSAMFSALAVVSLYIASVWPTGQLGLAAFSSLFVAATVIELGIAPGIYVFIVTSALGALLLPNRAPALLYVLFFGYYPILKNLAEKIRNIAAQWALKLVFFNIALTVIWFLLKELIFRSVEFSPGAIVLYLCGNAVFALFDYGYSKVLLFYTHNISKSIKKGR